MKTIFEKSKSGRGTAYFPAAGPNDKPASAYLPAKALRAAPPLLPEVSELEIVRHFTELSHRTFSIDGNFYPLGSCTMKYNPKINEKIAAMAGFAKLHPLQPAETVQGLLEIMWTLERMLAEISGMDAVTLQPAAGAQGELTGLLLIRSHHQEQKQDQRTEILIPDSAHGTNPATATLSGYKTVSVKSDDRGGVDLEDLKKKLSDKTAGMMITNPSTLGLFEENIQAIAELVHKAGGLMYMDGANMNAIQGKARPGDFGIDVMHFNLHKTFSTPHGGGGPGSGPVACKSHLEPFLPVPRVVEANGEYHLEYNRPKTIGALHSFFGNFGIYLRAYTYIMRLGSDGIRRASSTAILNANYLAARIAKQYPIPYGTRCMHEFVASGEALKEKHGIRTLDVAKRLLDFGFYAPTVYFPLTVAEALMVEPTETESRETLDRFADALLEIAREAATAPDVLHEAPTKTPVRRLDEATANRSPVITVPMDA